MSEPDALEWAHYLEQIRDGVLALDEDLLSGRDPMPLLLAVPSTPVPAHLQQRAAMLLPLLQDVTDRVQQRRDELAAHLRTLPAPRSSPRPHSARVGAALDVSG